MDAIFDLVSSNCLTLLSRRLLMDFNLVWGSCFSAILSIFFALSDFKVDFNFMLTGTKSLCKHLSVKCDNIFLIY